MALFKPDINRIKNRVAQHRSYERVARKVRILNQKYAVNSLVGDDLVRYMKTPPKIYYQAMLNIPQPSTAVGLLFDLADEREYFEIEFPEELDPDKYPRLYEDDEHDGHF